MKKKVKVKKNYKSSREFGQFALLYFSFSCKESNSCVLVITRGKSEEATRNT